uniref:hypothetical protein n=1 Tax=Roseovarius indicus TaxID=540747 RepID=UPI003B51BA95
MTFISKTLSTIIDIAKSLALIAILCLPTEGSAENMGLCIEVDREWGTMCNRDDSLHVIVTNRCPSTTYIKVCVQEKGGKWSCGSDNSLEPGETNRGFWACKATGDYDYAACTGGYSECGFKR